MADAPTPQPTPFGNGWNEYRRLLLSYMEEEKQWRTATDARLTAIEKSLAVFFAQKTDERLHKMEDVVRDAVQLVKSAHEQLKSIREANALSRSNSVKIWIAVITGGLALVGTVLSKIL